MAPSLETNPSDPQMVDVKLGSNQPVLGTAEISQAKTDLAACFRFAARLGLSEGICNHFSCTVPGHDDLFIVNPHGYAFAEITASRLLICDFNGNVVDGEGRPEATAFFIHGRMHLTVPRAKAAFHAHMPYSTALIMTEGEPLIFAGQTALKFYGRTAFDENYNGLALDGTEGDRIAAAAGTADIIFMKNHGVMVLGPSIAEAWDDLYYLERACEAQCIALSTGRKVNPVTKEVAEAAARQIRAADPEAGRLHLASIRRILDREDPSYKD